MKKIVFLDVDGVLNNDGTEEKAPSGYLGVSDELIERLGRIVQSQNAEVALSSDWRLSENDPKDCEDYLYLKRKLEAFGIRISGGTPDIRASRRGQEIRAYLDALNEEAEWVVLDDVYFSDFDRFGITERLVLTDGADGLTEKDVSKAVGILNGRRSE